MIQESNKEREKRVGQRKWNIVSIEKKILEVKNNFYIRKESLCKQ